MGQQENAKGMIETFQQLLKEFPKSSVAAQAHYYIGKAAFEAKDYKTAINALETARKLNKEQYYTSHRCGDFFRVLPRRSACSTNEVNDFSATVRTKMSCLKFSNGWESNITMRRSTGSPKNI